jgi:hypothetical protein
VFVAARPRFKQCWEQTPSTQQTGRASLRVNIAPSGRVSTAEVKDSDLPEFVNRCLVGEARRMQFPAASDPTVVTFPLVFRR